MRISSTKTKYLLAGGSDRDRARIGSRVSADGDDLEEVEEFCYLGTIVIYTPILRKLAHICPPDVYARNFLFRNFMRFEKRMFVKRV